MRKSSRGVAAVCLWLALSGFYVTDSPVLDRGECVSGAAGTHACEGMGTKIFGTSTEIRSGQFNPTCTYQSSQQGGVTSVMKQVSQGLYLQQGIAKAHGLITYQFVEMVDKDRYNIYLPAPGAFGQIRQLMQQYGIRGEQDMRGFIKLLGSRDRIEAFLMAHNQSMLVAAGTCRRER